ncbi:MAG: hypothetical protein JO185_02555 [Acidobacteriaceae bacterium]|nr:hypothetical protein [Acidobacteriaceae bacterium]
MANKVRDFKSALGSSMRAEQNRATDRQLDRFARAEAIMDSGGGKSLELERPERERVVRDSFTLPAMDYQRIARIQERALKAGFHANKSEIMRAGLLLLDEFSDNELTSALSRVEKIKTGRPADKSV